MLLDVLGIVCGLAICAFAAHEPARARTALVFAAALAGASAVIGPTRVPDPVWAAAIAAAGAGIALWRPAWTPAAIACAGVLAGVWVSVLAAHGLPAPLAYALAAGVAAASSGLAARRPGFAPVHVREEALVLVAALAVILAASPAIATGWNSAAALRAAPLARPAVDAAAWAFALAAGAALFGAIHSLWRRR